MADETQGRWGPPKEAIDEVRLPTADGESVGAAEGLELRLCELVEGIGVIRSGDDGVNVKDDGAVDAGDGKVVGFIRAAKLVIIVGVAVEEWFEPRVDQGDLVDDEGLGEVERLFGDTGLGRRCPQGPTFPDIRNEVWTEIAAFDGMDKSEAAGKLIGVTPVR